MKNKQVSSLVVMAMIVCGGVAHAGFAVEEPGTAVSTSARSNAGLAQMGIPDSSQQMSTVRGVAREISLLIALKQIVPQGWKAKRAGGLDINQMVSWRGEGRSWVAVLQDMAVANNFTAMIDWTKHEVTVAPAQFTPTGDGLHPSSVVAAAAPSGVRTWELVPTLTLRENIEGWAKSAGWSVSWASVDYPVTAKVSITGGFDDELNGPLVQLAKAYGAAEQPLTFTFYTNRVVRVENSTYRQVNVRDQAPNPRAMQ